MAAPKKEIKAVEKPAGKFSVFSLIYKLNLIFALVFLVLWILIGVFFSFLIMENLKAMASQKVTDSIGTQTNQSAPTETSMPGVGKVNIACVEKAVSSDTIQKVFTDNGTNNLSADDKAKLEACVVPGGEATPTASPAN